MYLGNADFIEIKNLYESYSDPNQTFSMKLFVGYFYEKLRLGPLDGFLNMPTLYIYTYIYIYNLKIFYFF